MTEDTKPSLADDLPVDTYVPTAVKSGAYVGEIEIVPLSFEERLGLKDQFVGEDKTKQMLQMVKGLESRIRMVDLRPTSGKGRSYASYRDLFYGFFGNGVLQELALWLMRGDPDEGNVGGQRSEDQSALPSEASKPESQPTPG